MDEAEVPKEDIMHYNRITIVGFVGSDPEIRVTESGKKFAYLSVATNQYLGKNEDGTVREKTDWHNIVAWENLAEVVGNHLRKGTHVLIEGSLHYSTFEKGDQKLTRSQIRASAVRKLDRPEKQEAVPPPTVENDEDVPF